MPQEPPVSQLSQEYDSLARLFDLQPTQTRHFLDRQAASLAAVLDQGRGLNRYQLPDWVILKGGEAVELAAAARRRTVSWNGDPSERLIHSLEGLEQSFNPALAVCGSLLRYTVARHILFQLLPDGQRVHYQPESGEDLPSIPVGELQPAALLAASDALVEAGEDLHEGNALPVPYVDAARRFYLPQWVVFGDDDQLLVGSFEEAEACIASLQHAVRLLEQAVAICPGLVTDETYQRKRAGLLGQLVNQGRALARSYTRQIVTRVRARAADGTLNRGLAISLPYFDDESLSICTHPVEVIPGGRILFVPAFVVRAMRLSETEIQRDARLNPSTRKHLLAELTCIEGAFNGHSSH